MVKVHAAKSGRIDFEGGSASTAPPESRSDPSCTRLTCPSRNVCFGSETDISNTHTFKHVTGYENQVANVS
jgi:hypothetical protein